MGTKSLWLKSQDVDIFDFPFENLFNRIKQNALTRHFFFLFVFCRIEKEINSYPRVYRSNESWFSSLNRVCICRPVMCVRVIDIGQSSHYWNSSALSRRKGMKNKNRTSFDDIGTYSASATYCWKISRLLQAKWVVETLRWVLCSFFLIMSRQTLL